MVDADIRLGGNASAGAPDNDGGPQWPIYSASNDQTLEFGPDGVTVRQDHEKDRLGALELVAQSVTR